MDKEKIEKLLHVLIDLKHDNIHEYNPNGADWHVCRLCYASSVEIRGVFQGVDHDPDCPGVIAQELLDKFDGE